MRSLCESARSLYQPSFTENESIRSFLEGPGRRSESGYYGGGPVFVFSYIYIILSLSLSLFVYLPLSLYNLVNADWLPLRHM